MLNFKEISISDKLIFDKYLTKIDTPSYEYLFSSLFIWRNCYKISYAFIDETLIVRKIDENKNSYFMMPYGYNENNLNKILTLLIQNCSEDSIYLFGDIDNSFVKDLNLYTNYSFDILPDNNCFEYVYLTKDLISLSGSKYHNKRSHINTFINNYDFTVKSIDDDKVILDCLKLVDTWQKNIIVKSQELLFERLAIEDALYNLKNINLESIAIYVGDSLIGFSLGEKFNDTAIIHIEKCDKSFLGSYAFINREFLIRSFSDTIYVNRQEDCGVPGMRKAKYSYHPNHMIEKFLVKVN